MAAFRSTIASSSLSSISSFACKPLRKRTSTSLSIANDTPSAASASSVTAIAGTGRCCVAVFPPSTGANPSRNPSMAAWQRVLEWSSDEIDRVTDDAFRSCSWNDRSRMRSGKGVAVVWFRNDLRILDNEALLKAWMSSEALLPVYCFDPRLFGTTHYFGFPKTGCLFLCAIFSTYQMIAACVVSITASIVC